jgi:hypothetical protein
MKHAAYALAGVILLSAHPYSCHKPTLQEGYAEGRACFAALDANLRAVPADGFRKARIDRDKVAVASSDNMTGAFGGGERMGMKPNAILQDYRRGSAEYLASHSWQPPGGGRRQFMAFGNEVTECLDDYYGRPND